MDVMGIAFRRELYLSTRQVFPPLQDREKSVHTKMQAKLLRKLGDNAYPFFFEVKRRCVNPGVTLNTSGVGERKSSIKSLHLASMLMESWVKFLLELHSKTTLQLSRELKKLKHNTE